MTKPKSSAEIIDKMAKSSMFPNITTAYAVINPQALITSETSAAIKEDNKKAP